MIHVTTTAGHAMAWLDGSAVWAIVKLLAAVALVSGAITAAAHYIDHERHR